jgi:hypothetical protein
VWATNTIVSRGNLNFSSLLDHTNTARDRAWSGSPVAHLAVNWAGIHRAVLFFIVVLLIVATTDLRSTLEKGLCSESFDFLRYRTA